MAFLVSAIMLDMSEAPQMVQTSQIGIQTSGCGALTIECGCGLVLQHHDWKD
jgi:hypothetical protein